MRSAAARPRPSRPQAFPCLFGIGYGTIERLLIAGAIWSVRKYGELQRLVPNSQL
jgi:hypothetical protein